MKRKAKLMDKRGVFGMDAAKAFVIAMLVIGAIAFASLIAIDNLNAAHPEAGTGTLAANQSASVLGNISDGTEDFFTNAGTWFSLLAVVVIILIIAVVIVAVNRFGGRSGGGL